MNGEFFISKRIMSSIVTLLSPFWLAWKNDFLRSGQQWRRRWLLLALAIAFWSGIYYVVRRVLLYFQSVYDLGPSLAYQLLLIILLTFLSMLLFSNLITALSSFFLARDLDLLLSTPVSAGSFYYSRVITTILNSSWMVLFFSLPIFAAYGTVFGSGISFYLWVAVVLPLFLIIPASVGVLVTHLLVYCLPVKRIRDILFFIGLFSFMVIYFLFRFAQPQRLVQPESFGHFLLFLAAMETPASPLLPSSWSAEVLAAPLFKRPTDQGFFYALLASYALFLPLVTSWISGAIYLTGWSKAQESKQGRRKYEIVESALDWLTCPFPPVLRALIVKDIKTFLRDSTQWSQLFLLTCRLDHRLSLQFQGAATRSLSDADRDLESRSLLCEPGFGRLRIERGCRALRLSRGQSRRKGFLDSANRADLPAYIAVEQALAQSHSAADPRRTARVSKQPAAAGSLVDDDAFSGDGFADDVWDHRHLCRRGRPLPKIHFRPCGGNPHEFRRSSLHDREHRFYRRCCLDRSLADLFSCDAWVESRPIDGAGVMGHCSISAWCASPDLGRCHRAHQTRPEKLGAAQGLTKHSCICQVKCGLKPAKR